jgi:hypothetical protein
VFACDEPRERKKEREIESRKCVCVRKRVGAIKAGVGSKRGKRRQEREKERDRV